MANGNKVTLKLDDMDFKVYGLLISRLMKEGFTGPFKSVKISISPKDLKGYKSITEMEGMFPGDQDTFNSKVEKIRKEIEESKGDKIKCYFKKDEIDKNNLSTELQKRGFETELNDLPPDRFCIVINIDSDSSETKYYHVEKGFFPDWLFYAIRDASIVDGTSEKNIDVEISYDE